MTWAEALFGPGDPNRNVYAPPAAEITPAELAAWKQESARAEHLMQWFPDSPQLEFMSADGKAIEQRALRAQAARKR